MVLETVLKHWQSMLLYVVVLSFSAFFVYLGYKSSPRKKYLKKMLIALALIFPILLAGLRYNVGVDFRNYAKMVERAHDGVDIWPRKIEPLSSLIIHGSGVFNSSIMMFTAFSIVTVVFAFLAIKRLSPKEPCYLALSWLIYLFIVFPTTFNAVRSGAAVSIMTFAFSSLLVRGKNNHRRLAEFISWAMVAILFHISALICLPIGIAIYLISKDGKINQKLEKLLVGLASLIAIMFPLTHFIIASFPLEIISNLARYFREAGEHFSIPIGSVLMLLGLILSTILNRHEVSSNLKMRTMYSLAVYYIPISIIIGWLSYYTGTSRLAFYIEPIIVVLMVYAVKNGVRRWGKNKVASIAVVLFLLLFSSAMMARNLVWARALPYNTVLIQRFGDGNTK